MHYQPESTKSNIITIYWWSMVFINKFSIEFLEGHSNLSIGFKDVLVYLLIHQMLFIWSYSPEVSFLANINTFWIDFGENWVEGKVMPNRILW